ncbi:polyphosphate polymerase domain-containing protein [Acholeplasma vituli]|uniref:Polyphosphate polymerase domain-containing protein n=1 Tax=Paracholeplasma vituli TaxID=69473 RepID=A0ABT2PV76_9MOLU|nr:polyphosphate polymerase domain-containing protein [Paracholeplasma vituli]MCU0104735.1 polyphosphate polymerase domain-containing protein [Paracholeplasma vituli]
MSAGQSFNRFEKKYLVTKKEKDELVDFLTLHLKWDEFSIDSAYTIYNVYYDTLDHNIIRQSLDKPPYKAKLRVRSYRCPIGPEDAVYLEIKKKIQGKVTKRRLTMRYQDVEGFVFNGLKPDPNDFVSIQVLNEISYYLQCNQIIPKYYIAYERRALTDDTGLLRVTIDESIQYREDSVSLYQAGGKSLLPKDHYLIEIKSEHNFPLWLAHKLSTMGLFSRSFSKYGEAYRLTIQGDK